MRALVVVFVSSLTFLGSPVADAAAEICAEPSEVTIAGTTGNDRIVGTPRNDIILTYGGDDIVSGRGGGDLICTGAGDDRILPSPGEDDIRAGKGNDRISGEPNLDWLDGQAGDDVIYGGGYVGGVVVGGVLLIVCALALAWPTLRVIRAPRERWIQGRSQWLLFIWARRGEAPPSAAELRLWASIWLGVATVLLGLGIALIASA